MKESRTFVVMRMQVLCAIERHGQKLTKEHLQNEVGLISEFLHVVSFNASVHKSAIDSYLHDVIYRVVDGKKPYKFHVKEAANWIVKIYTSGLVHE